MTQELKVYAITEDDGTRCVVASAAKARAAKLLGISQYRLSVHGEITTKPGECERALSDPGAVWMLPKGALQLWVKAKDSTHDKKLPTRGGKRAGAGQPRLSEGTATQRGFRMDDENYALFMARGGAKFMRKVLASGIDLSDEEWTAFNDLGGGTWLREQIAAFINAQR